jgi:ribosome-associated heat shock protein Hsp15
MTQRPEQDLGTGRTQRVDQWLWHARIFKTRSLAAKTVLAGKVRVNQQRVPKASHTVRVGDVVTVPQGDWVRVLRIAALATRRGPAAEAQSLFEDLSPERPPTGRGANTQAPASGERPRGAGRPTKRERRKLERLLGPGER